MPDRAIASLLEGTDLIDDPFTTDDEPGAEAYGEYFGLTDGVRGAYDRSWMDTVATDDRLTTFGRPNLRVPSAPERSLPPQSWGYGFVSDWNGQIGDDRPSPEGDLFNNRTPIVTDNFQALYPPDYAPEFLYENPAIMGPDVQPAFELPPAFAQYIATS